MDGYVERNMVSAIGEDEFSFGVQDVFLDLLMGCWLLGSVDYRYSRKILAGSIEIKHVWLLMYVCYGI